ncbi:MAG TPA: diacylglycerol kinase [Gammaproteobacteria bacterium]|nr:diacylglycerol kinase [Gammaproteobacteria bacterium]
MTMKNKGFIERLGFAWSGLRMAWRRERSLRIQTGVALAAMLALLVLRPALIWWALLGLMISLVLAAELINTALEELTDHLHPELHPRIKFVKDCAAAAVLVLSIGALWVGGLMVLSVF